MNEVSFLKGPHEFSKPTPSRIKLGGEGLSIILENTDGKLTSLFQLGRAINVSFEVVE